MLASIEVFTAFCHFGPEKVPRANTRLWFEWTVMVLGGLWLYQEEYDGRLARRAVVWEDTVIELVSVYIPATAGDRKRYLNKLLQNSPLNRDTIVGGDFNCVINIKVLLTKLCGANGRKDQHPGPTSP